MKIAIIQPRASYYVGGGEKVSLRHAVHLSKIEGNSVDFFTIKPVDNKYSPIYHDLKNSKVNVFEKNVADEFIDIYNIEPGLNQERWDRESIMFKDLILEDVLFNGYDVVISYYVGDVLIKNTKTSNVVYLGGHSRENIAWQGKVLNYCIATISNSENVQMMWKNEISNARVKFNYILPKGVDNFSSSDVNKKDIVFAGRLIKRKGVDILIRVFSELNFSGKLYILGEGPQRRELIVLAKKLGVQDRVIFMGPVSNVEEYFSRALICCFPSREGEGLMTVVAEAMMSGSCVVTTRGHGSEEIIDNNKTGILVEPNSIDALSVAMNDLLSNSSKVNEIGNNARKYAKNNFSWNKVVSKLDNILKEVIKNSIL